MGSRPQLLKALLALAGIAVLSTVCCLGCSQHSLYLQPAASPLGTLSDPVWQNQELNAERSDFVIHEHEFALDSEFLNRAGEDHVKQIAARLAAGHDGLVLVERSLIAARPETEHKYPVHANSDLDMRRREMVVRCLMAMRVPAADARVVVAPDLAPQYRAGERAATYSEGYSGYGSNWGGGDWGGGGWGGGGWSATNTPSTSSYAGEPPATGPIGSAPAPGGYRR